MGIWCVFFYDGIWSFYVCVNIKNIYIYRYIAFAVHRGDLSKIIVRTIILSRVYTWYLFSLMFCQQIDVLSVLDRYTVIETTHTLILNDHHEKKIDANDYVAWTFVAIIWPLNLIACCMSEGGIIGGSLIDSLVVSHWIFATWTRIWGGAGNYVIELDFFNMEKNKKDERWVYL